MFSCADFMKDLDFREGQGRRIVKWLIALALGGCAAVADDDEIYECHVVAQFLICAPERAVA
jgi:hypothetical protein